jgi:hypothetical protein
MRHWTDSHNHPANLPALGIPPETLADLTRRNAQHFFGF